MEEKFTNVTGIIIWYFKGKYHIEDDVSIQVNLKTEELV